jgi:carbamate kinase
MAPKIRALVRFLEQGGRRGVVCCPEQIPLAVDGRAGTQIVG